MNEDGIIDFDQMMREFERRIQPALDEPLPGAGARPAQQEPMRSNGRRSGPSATHAQPAGFTYISLAELLDRPEPAYRFVVDELLPQGGSSLLVAKPKVGKTILALQCARDVAAGARFLDRAVQQGPVLYHAFEEKDSEVQRVMRRAQAERDWPIFFHFAEIPRDRIAALRAGITAHRPALVIIDTLAYWMQIEDFDDYAQVGRAMRPLHALARETDCHILAVHHAGKTKEGIDAALGSTALTANVDTIMVESEMDQGRTLESKQRYGTPLARTLLRFDEQTGCLTMGDGVAQAKESAFEDEVLRSVHEGHSTETAIRADLRCDKSRLLAALNSLVRRSLLIRSGAGHRNSPYMYAVVCPDEGGSDECLI